MAVWLPLDTFQVAQNSDQVNPAGYGKIPALVPYGVRAQDGREKSLK